MKVLVIGPHCWGKGETLEEAFKNALQNAPSDMRDSRRKKDYRGKKAFSVHIVSDTTTVNGMGGITYPLAEGEPLHLGYLDIDRKLLIDLDDYSLSKREVTKPVSELFDEEEERLAKQG